jgi:xanthine/CO dehydrogenase XdhC/CoxF family maturation factor
MDGGDALQRRLDTLLAQQLAERIENDAIADAEEEMEGGRNDTLGKDGEEWLLACGARMLVCCSAVTCCAEVVVVRNNADGTAKM